MKNALNNLVLVLFVIAMLAGVLFLGLVTSWFGLVTARPMAMYQQETERQVYQNSIARQQGANSGIAQDCANMQSNTGAQQLAFAQFVITDAAAYSGNQGLSADALTCVQSAKNLIATNQ